MTRVDRLDAEALARELFHQVPSLSPERTEQLLEALALQLGKVSDEVLARIGAAAGDEAGRRLCAKGEHDLDEGSVRGDDLVFACDRGCGYEVVRYDALREPPWVVEPIEVPDRPESHHEALRTLDAAMLLNAVGWDQEPHLGELNVQRDRRQALIQAGWAWASLSMWGLDPDEPELAGDGAEAFAQGRADAEAAAELEGAPVHTPEGEAAARDLIESALWPRSPLPTLADHLAHRALVDAALGRVTGEASPGDDLFGGALRVLAEGHLALGRDSSLAIQQEDGTWARAVCRHGHPLAGAPDHCGQVYCEPCGGHMTPRVPDEPADEVCGRHHPLGSQPCCQDPSEGAGFLW